VTTVCVPVLRRYDLLRGLLLSLASGTVLPRVSIIDNGRNPEKLAEAIAGVDALKIDTFSPNQPMGVAESWNWFIKNVEGDRIITNDDVVFAPESVEKIVACPYDLVWTKEAGFSCFLIRDECVRVIGLFDEMISPGYGYYEDCDYMQRVDGRGTRDAMIKRGDVVCGVEHLKSQTLESYTRAELNEHHRKFRIAQGNYIKKWGLEETFK
jgi:hypothetical protein